MIITITAARAIRTKMHWLADRKSNHATGLTKLRKGHFDIRYFLFDILRFKTRKGS